MDVLQELLARAAQQVPAYDVPVQQPSQVKSKQSLLGRLFGVDPKKSPFPDVGTPSSEGAPIVVPPWSEKVGIIAPGIGGLGNLDAATTRAPISPVDPNYADPATSVSPFMTPVQRQMQVSVDPAAANAPRPPMPTPRPREADGSIAPPPANPPSTDLSSRAQRGAAAEDEEAAGPQPGRPQLAAPSLWDQAGVFGNNAMNFLRNNSSTLLALGAGFAGAPNIGQGISRAAQYAIPATQQDLKNRMMLQNQSQTYQALIEAGVPPQQALASIGNPELQKRLLDSYITDRKWDIKTIKSKNGWGEETEKLVAVNPYDPTKTIDMSNGAPAAGGGNAAVVASSGGKSAFYAPGVSDENVDMTNVGDDFLGQFSPDVQQAAKDYLAGRTAQTGRQLPQQRIKMIAQKYGADVGMPADDAAIGQRKQWSNSLGNTSSGVGLQVKGLQQGLEHFAKISDALVKMKLSNGGGWETGANWINWLKSQSTAQQDLIHKAQFEGQSLAGEMGNLFSKNGGGVHERAKTAELISNAFMSSKAAAGSLDGVLEMIDGGLSTLEQRRDELFPNEADRPRGSNFIGPKQVAALEKIKNNIAILRGGEAPAPSAPASASSGARVVAPAPGRYAYDPATGTMKPLQ